MGAASDHVTGLEYQKTSIWNFTKFLLNVGHKEPVTDDVPVYRTKVNRKF